MYRKKQKLYIPASAVSALCGRHIWEPIEKKSYSVLTEYNKEYFRDIKRALNMEIIQSDPIDKIIDVVYEEEHQNIFPVINNVQVDYSEIKACVVNLEDKINQKIQQDNDIISKNPVNVEKIRSKVLREREEFNKNLIVLMNLIKIHPI